MMTHMCIDTTNLKMGERMVKAEDVQMAYMAAIRGTFGK